MKSVYYATILCATATLMSAPAAMAIDHTTGIIVGAAIGGVAGKVIGNDVNSTLIGAAAGGLLGHLLSKDDPNYYRDGYYRKHYYRDGRRFDNKRDYDAYRDAMRERGIREREDAVGAHAAREYMQHEEDRGSAIEHMREIREQHNPLLNDH